MTYFVYGGFEFFAQALVRQVGAVGISVLCAGAFASFVIRVRQALTPDTSRCADG